MCRFIDLSRRRRDGETAERERNVSEQPGRLELAPNGQRSTKAGLTSIGTAVADLRSAEENQQLSQKSVVAGKVRLGDSERLACKQARLLVGVLLQRTLRGTTAVPHGAISGGRHRRHREVVSDRAEV